MSTILSTSSRQQTTDQIEQFIGEMVATFQPEAPKAPGKRGRPRVVPALNFIYRPIKFFTLTAPAPSSTVDGP